MAVRAIRGAIQVVENSKESLEASVPKLLSQMVIENGLSFEDVISILFTATVDLDADFPAAAARTLPIGEIPLICASEIDVPGALPRIVRVMMHVNTNLERGEITHLYLDGAQSLRRDLAQ
jgi:chorismate mutase